MKLHLSRTGRKLNKEGRFSKQLILNSFRKIIKRFPAKYDSSKESRVREVKIPGTEITLMVKEIRLKPIHSIENELIACEIIRSAGFRDRVDIPIGRIEDLEGRHYVVFQVKGKREEKLRKLIKENKNQNTLFDLRGELIEFIKTEAVLQAQGKIPVDKIKILFKENGPIKTVYRSTEHDIFPSMEITQEEREHIIRLGNNFIPEFYPKHRKELQKLGVKETIRLNRTAQLIANLVSQYSEAHSELRKKELSQLEILSFFEQLWENYLESRGFRDKREKEKIKLIFAKLNK